ncbi:MAG: hypothetical protein RL630_402 [Verrucomicrobiota bacterium]
MRILAMTNHTNRLRARLSKSHLAPGTIGFSFCGDGGRSLCLSREARAERKVRTPQGSMPRRTRGRPMRKPRSTDSVTENRPPTGASRRVRVKRRGKSPPPRAQARGHEKPHAVQDRTGGTGSPARSPRKRGAFRVLVAVPQGTAAGARAPASRQMTVQTCGASRGLDRIRLTAITQRGRFGNGAPPAFLIKKSPLLKLAGSTGCDF